ncbi:MAG: ABC transporter ATP-binding protein [Rectinemataceae bacterium]
MSYIELRRVSKSFSGRDGEAAAVSDFNLRAEEGELIVLVGPSGCGKTTTLRMIAGLEDPTDGEIEIDGKIVNDIHPKDRDIAMVFQDYALYPHLTVKENLSFGLENARLDKAEIVRRIAEAASFLDLEPLMGRLPKQLSGGQQQRVAVGRALVRKPTAVLLDEPLSNLDAKLRVATRKNIDDIHKRTKAVMVYVTHDQVEAMTLGDRIVVMDKGRIQQVADPRTLYMKPANLFVAGFIGTPPMNLVNGKALDAHSIECEGSIFSLTAPCEGLAARAGKNIVMGIRPERIHALPRCAEPEPKPESAAGMHNTITAVPDFVEYLGNESLVHFQMGGAAMICRSPADDSLKSSFDEGIPQEDATCTFRFDPEAIHLFDPETGLRFGQD